MVVTYPVRCMVIWYGATWSRSIRVLFRPSSRHGIIYVVTSARSPSRRHYWITSRCWRSCCMGSSRWRRMIWRGSTSWRRSLQYASSRSGASAMSARSTRRSYRDAWGWSSRWSSRRMRGRGHEGVSPSSRTSSWPSTVSWSWGSTRTSKIMKEISDCFITTSWRMVPKARIGRPSSWSTYKKH